jgi:hypothetical protein
MYLSVCVFIANQYDLPQRAVTVAFSPQWKHLTALSSPKVGLSKGMQSVFAEPVSITSPSLLAAILASDSSFDLVLT